MTEPDVTLTDYALAIQCAAFAFLLARSDEASRLRAWFVVFFAGVAAAAIFGGTFHGFFEYEPTFGQRVLWSATLLSIGVSALAGFALAAHVAFAPGTARAVERAAKAPAPARAY